MHAIKAAALTRTINQVKIAQFCCLVAGSFIEPNHWPTEVMGPEDFFFLGLLRLRRVEVFFAKNFVINLLNLMFYSS
jgi:hypothetical protein